MSWEGFSGVRVLALPGDVCYAANHGVYLTDPQVGARRFAFEKNVNSLVVLQIVLRTACCVLCVVSQDQVKDILYRGAPEEILQARRPDGKVPLVCWSKIQQYCSGHISKCTIDKSLCPPRVCVYVQVSGPVFFSRSVSEKLLQTHVTPPLDGCTYLGLDSGAPPVQVQLMHCMRCMSICQHINTHTHAHTL